MFWYYDGARAQVGDTCQSAVCGTCTVRKIDEEQGVILLVNTQTGETWDINSVCEFDLIDRAA